MILAYLNWRMNITVRSQVRTRKHGISFFPCYCSGQEYSPPPPPSMDSGKRKVNMQTVFIPRVHLIDLCRYKVDTTPSVQKSHITPFVNETGLPELGAKSPNNWVSAFMAIVTNMLKLSLPRLWHLFLYLFLILFYPSSFILVSIFPQWKITVLA